MPIAAIFMRVVGFVRASNVARSPCPQAPVSRLKAERSAPDDGASTEWATASFCDGVTIVTTVTTITAVTTASFCDGASFGLSPTRNDLVTVTM